MALGFVFGTMFLLFILMLPFGILLALIGITFKSLFAMALFALKYLLPYGIIGFLIARKRAQDIYFPMRKYFKYIVLSLGAGFALLLILLNTPFTPEVPEAEFSFRPPFDKLLEPIKDDIAQINKNKSSNRIGNALVH